MRLNNSLTVLPSASSRLGSGLGGRGEAGGGGRGEAGGGPGRSSWSAAEEGLVTQC